MATTTSPTAVVAVATVLHTAATAGDMADTDMVATQCTDRFRCIPSLSTEYQFTVVDTAATAMDIATATSLFGCIGPSETGIAPCLIWPVEFKLRQVSEMPVLIRNVQTSQIGQASIV